jgi:molybdenum cofactor cytidylyltransferase
VSGQNKKMNTGKLNAIVLAAGLSNRMHDFKPLMRIGQETITDRVISIFLANDIEVFLVTGWHQRELISGISHRDIHIVENPNYKDGMFSSIRTGVSHLTPESPGFFIMPVDVPLVRPTTIKRLLEAVHSNPGHIIYPFFNKKHGHPTFVPSCLIPEIMNQQKDGELKAILNSHANIHLEIPVADEFIHLDIDEPEDFNILMERFRNYKIPTQGECNAIMDIAGTAANVRRHCTKVAEIAVIISRALIKASHPVDVDAVRTAALLHDVTREKPRHSSAGNLFLREFGFERIGDIIEMHTELPHDIIPPLEAKIVFLADKFVRQEGIVSIEERYSASTRNYATTPEIAEIVNQRQKQALDVKTEIEVMLGYSLETIIFGTDD